jgi:heat shock protein HslJ
MISADSIAFLLRITVTLFAAGLLLMGCQGTGEKTTGSTQVQPTEHVSLTSTTKVLVNTRWHLVEFQSMDDAVGTKRSEDPLRYTMVLNGDGTVEMRLNCNSATGTWSAESGQDDPFSGRFEFGLITATSALCPPPSLDEQISSQTQYVRSFLLKDGRLYLSLMADGGIYVWEPQTDEPFQTKPDPNLKPHN